MSTPFVFVWGVHSRGVYTRFRLGSIISGRLQVSRAAEAVRLPILSLPFIGIRGSDQSGYHCDQPRRSQLGYSLPYSKACCPNSQSYPPLLKFSFLAVDSTSPSIRIPLHIHGIFPLHTQRPTCSPTSVDCNSLPSTVWRLLPSSFQDFAFTKQLSSS